jgi:hypothetical protein
MGVSVENRRFAHRIDHLRCTDAHVMFLSLEPLEDLDLRDVDWVTPATTCLDRWLDPKWVAGGGGGEQRRPPERFAGRFAPRDRADVHLPADQRCPKKLIKSCQV